MKQSQYADLHKFAITQEAIHAGVIRAGRCWTRGLALLILAQTIQVRLGASKHPSKKNETRNLQGVEAGCADRHAHLGSQYSGHDQRRAKRIAARQPFEVSYNLSTK